MATLSPAFDAGLPSRATRMRLNMAEPPLTCGRTRCARSGKPIQSPQAAYGVDLHQTPGEAGKSGRLVAPETQPQRARQHRREHAVLQHEMMVERGERMRTGEPHDRIAEPRVQP